MRMGQRLGSAAAASMTLSIDEELCLKSCADAQESSWQCTGLVVRRLEIEASADDSSLLPLGVPGSGRHCVCLCTHHGGDQARS
jgi:hypothetical protein